MTLALTALTVVALLQIGGLGAQELSPVDELPAPAEGKAWDLA